ncbi:MAG: lipoprotein [Methylotenera sp.]|nr:lipoprotein [Methylotenera sp.]
MQKITARILLLAAICCVLNSCGIKGPLYIPEQKYPQTTPASQ